MKIRLDNLKANPFRNLDEYPKEEAKREEF